MTVKDEQKKKRLLKKLKEKEITAKIVEYSHTGDNETLEAIAELYKEYVVILVAEVNDCGDGQ